MSLPLLLLPLPCTHDTRFHPVSGGPITHLTPVVTNTNGVLPLLLPPPLAVLLSQPCFFLAHACRCPVPDQLQLHPVFVIGRHPDVPRPHLRCVHAHYLHRNYKKTLRKPCIMVDSLHTAAVNPPSLDSLTPVIPDGAPPPLPPLLLPT